MIGLSIIKPQAQPNAPSHTGSTSLFSFVPEGVPRSIVEYMASAIPGAILLFAFFVASESAVVFLGGDAMVVTFLPVVCLIPILAGMVSALVLEKVRAKPLSFKRGALLGAAAGLLGTLISSAMILVVFLVGKKPFGSIAGDLVMVLITIVFVIGIGTILSALGGAIAVKFIKEI